MNPETRIPTPEELAKSVELGEELPERHAYVLTTAFKTTPSVLLQSAVERLVGHSIELVRQSALDALVESKSPKPEYLELAAGLMERDKDSGTRAFAALAVASLSKRFNSRGALTRLAQVVRNEREDQHVRLNAYWSILSILGVPVSERPRVTDEKWDPETGVDLALLESIEQTKD